MPSRSAISINKGPWIHLTWKGAKSKECAFGQIILNDPVEASVKSGDVIYVRTEIQVPPNGKWGLGIQARSGDDNPNWTEGATNSGEDVLLSDKADFRPQLGLYTHSAHGVLKEVAMAREEVIPIVQIIGRRSGRNTPVAKAGRLYAWNWDNLKRLLGQ